MVLRISHIPFLEFGSRPDDGSSRKIIFEFPIKALAKQSFLLFPPDKFFANLPASFVRAHSSMTSLIFCYIFY